MDETCWDENVKKCTIYYCSVCEKVKEAHACHDDCDKVIHINDRLKKILEAIIKQPELILNEADHDSAERVRDFERSRAALSSLLKRTLNISISCHRSKVQDLREDLVCQLLGYRHESRQFSLITEKAFAMVNNAGYFSLSDILHA